MFAAFRERVGDTVKALVKDDADKAIITLLERGTSEQLLGPDWNVAFELVDLVNSQPMCVRVCASDACACVSARMYTRALTLCACPSVRIPL